mgnify:CR=1 FL=1
MSKDFAEKVHADELLAIQRMIGKLLQHDSAAEQELVEVFEMIDNKCSIDLRNLTDSYVQLKLHKIFKLLRLQHTKKNLLEFKKRTSSLHENMSMAKLVRHMIKKETEQKPESEVDDSSISDVSSSSES